jgi:hypothetical protein
LLLSINTQRTPFHHVKTIQQPFRIYRRTTIAVSLFLALGFSTESFSVESHTEKFKPVLRNSKVQNGPSIRSVASCADDGAPATLRHEIGQAAPGDTIDLSLLPCDTIVLNSQWVPSQIVVTQDALTIKGPDRSFARDRRERNVPRFPAYRDGNTRAR